MKPKIKTPEAWQQAELLMQPALIRVLDHIRKRLETSVWKGSYQDVTIPIPGYRLNLQYQDQTLSFDVWELCYQVCFSNYRPTHAPQETLEVEIDTNLIDEDHQVDWEVLEQKTSRVIDDLFASLPKIVA